MDMPRPWRELYDADGEDTESGFSPFAAEKYMQDEIDELRAYVDEVKKTSIIEIMALNGALVRLGRDTARMTFLETHPNWLRHRKKHFACVSPFTNYEYEVFKTARDAIDSAMREEGM